MATPWSVRVRRRLPHDATPLLLLRVLVIAASFVWLVLAPPGAEAPGLLNGVLASFAAYGVVLLVAGWTRPDVVIRWNLPVLALDVLFALTVIHLSGGVRSVFFLAFYVISALQAYYYGTRHGVLVALVTTALYLAVIWPTADATRAADIVLRCGFLLLTTVGLGVLGRLQAEERREITALNEELRARDRFVRDMLASTQDGVVVLDAQRRVSTWNRAMERISGTPAEAALGRPPAAVARWLGEGRLAAEVGAVYAGAQERFLLARVEGATAAGESRLLDVKGSAVRGPDGAFHGTTLFVEDVTAREALERSLRQTERLAGLGTLAAGLAHEVNNPIGVIVARVELLLEDAGALGLSREVRDDLQVIRNHARRVARITQGLLTFASQRGGDREAVDLNQVVGDTLALFETQARLEGVALRTQLAPALPPVPGDTVLLGQVVFDLLANAREALAGRGGTIEIETASEPKGVRLVVRDSGSGIAPEHLSRIFEPFFTTRPDGAGLGLAVCYGIVRDHGGRIDVESQPGAGTTVVVRLPVAGRNGGT
jgi:PAS domain S-box-containing protein